jgi:UDP-glucose 6-dehydrogenase
LEDNIKVITELKNLNEGHVLYCFESMEQYVKNVVAFVISGLEQDEYSIIIENDPICSSIKQSLAPMLNESDLNKVKFVNNFDFYYAKGNFQSNTIFEIFPHLLEDYPEQYPAVRSWSHVEWRDEREVVQKLAESEKESDIIIGETKLLSVCAYDSERISENLKKNLVTNHAFLLIDQEKDQEKLTIS